jgi:subtilisin family serine protease
VAIVEQPENEFVSTACDRATTPLELVRLPALMARSSGSAEVCIALMDGPVAADHPDLASANVREISGAATRTCEQLGSIACTHGTYVSGILVARRGSRAPAICPGCTLLVRPVFREAAGNGKLPVASSEELAHAIIECVDAGAQVVNLSVGTEPSTRAERGLQRSLDYAAMRGTLVVAAAGNQGTVGSSAITRHPWVVPVAAVDTRGRPIKESNLGGSMGRRGLGAPGESVESLGAHGPPLTMRGTSAAAAFVTGTVALLWSEFPGSASEIRHAITLRRRRTAVTPPLLDAEAACAFMATNAGRC